MNIQSISIVVPTKGCVNSCKFCVSRMHTNDYERVFNKFQIQKRIKWAVMNGVNTCIITGTGEALQNKNFLYLLSEIFSELEHPFPNVEFQTTGVLLTAVDNIQHLKSLGVNTISLSVSDIYDDFNMEIISAPPSLRFNLKELCDIIKKEGFNLRLSLNMTKYYDDATPQDLINRCKYLGADQVTFRRLYSADDNSEQSQWVKENACGKILDEIKVYIHGTPMEITNVGGFQLPKPGHPAYGTLLYKLPFGASVYSINGMSTVIDDDCMSKENDAALKYVILRENGKLYARWDDEGSLIF